MKRISLLFYIILMLCFERSIFAECWENLPKTIAKEEWRRESKQRFLLVMGDFNGDGKVDFAKFQISCDSKRIAAFAFIKNGNKYKSILLADIPLNAMVAYGIKLVKPGFYKGISENGNVNDLKSYITEKIRFDSIELFKNESVSSIFYYDTKTQKFKRLWISD